MKKKIALVGILFCYSFLMCLRNPAFRNGRTCITNIMLMLDNSGSMAWDLSGNQLTSNDFLNRPTDIAWIKEIFMFGLQITLSLKEKGIKCSSLIQMEHLKQ